MMQVKIKKLHENAVIPQYAKKGDAGLDLTATSLAIQGYNYVYGTGLAVEIPEGHVGLLFPRSSISKTGMWQTNSVGVIDSGYRGEIKVVLRTDGTHAEAYKVGERIAQLIIVPYPKIELLEVGELSDTDRGEGGFGSTN